MMQKKSALLGGAALGVLLAVGMSASADAKTVKHHHKPVVHGPTVEEQKVEALTEAVSTLEARLNEETQARQATEAQVQAAQSEAAAARADAQAARTELSEQIQTIPGAVQGQINTAIAANKPKTDKIYYKGITVTLGGFLEAAGIYRSKNDVADIASSYAKIPYGNAALSHVGELRGTARQSRVSFLAQGDINKTTHAAFYGEFDFLGGAQTANSNESNSYNPRIRNVYGTVDWDDLGLHVLAGQNWSLVTLNSKGISPRNEVTPPQIDAQYIPGFAWARQPQIRVTKDFADKQVWLAVSLENPQTTFNGTSLASGVSALTTQGAISGFDSANSLSLNHAPDVVGKLAFEPAIGGAHPVHLEVFGLWRDYYDRINVGTNAFGYPTGIYDSDTSGGGVGGSVTATLFPGLLDVQGSVLTGRGIGRYGSAQLSDVTLEPDGKIAPIPETMFLVGGTLHATKQLDLYVFGGDERESSRLFHTGTIGTSGTLYGFGIPGTGTAAGCTIDGGTCTTNTRDVFQITAGVWDKAYTGPYGQVRIGLQYSHTDLTAFTDYSGGVVHGVPTGTPYTPKTSDDMVMTSFRYYPF
jgi:outer membrane murein-binding lipoprotein Lpp